MREIFLLIAVASFSGCIPNMEPDKNILKSLKEDDDIIEWYNRSSAYAETPDYITISRNNIIDTICIADNIADIHKKSGAKIITIGFYGTPKKYTDSIQVPKNVFDYIIRIDTSYKLKR